MERCRRDLPKAAILVGCALYTVLIGRLVMLTWYNLEKIGSERGGAIQLACYVGVYGSLLIVTAVMTTRYVTRRRF